MKKQRPGLPGRRLSSRGALDPGRAARDLAVILVSGISSTAPSAPGAALRRGRPRCHRLVHGRGDLRRFIGVAWVQAYAHGLVACCDDRPPTTCTASSIVIGEVHLELIGEQIAGEDRVGSGVDQLDEEQSALAAVHQGHWDEGTKDRPVDSGGLNAMKEGLLGTGTAKWRSWLRQWSGRWGDYD